jgi:Tfp pilus assembly protein FimT
LLTKEADMRTQSRQPFLSGRPTRLSRQAGFSLVELLIVVIVIMITAAVALPGMLRFLRLYRVRGAAQQVASNIQTARSRAIMRNVNTGVLFRIYDSNTYRMAVEDAPFTAQSEGPLLDLPTNVYFIDTGATTNSMRFDRMGRWCELGTNGCPVPTVAMTCTPAARCAEAPGNYISSDATGALITVRDLSTGVGYVVGITPGGRVRIKDMINDATTAR